MFLLHIIHSPIYNHLAHLLTPSVRMKPNFQALPWLSVAGLME